MSFTTYFGESNDKSRQTAIHSANKNRRCRTSNKSRFVPVQQVARSYDMPVQTLGKWVSKARSGEKPRQEATPVSDQSAEISRLKALCARLTMERDILKKATAYFAKDSL
ncbi:MAG: hypothetical protein RIT15_1444 [Pseudomonadota bacterium]